MKTILASGFAEIINKLAPLFLIHYATGKIGLENFGSTQFTIGLLELLSILVILGYHQMAVMKVGQYLREGLEGEIPELAGRITALRLLGAVLVALPYLIYFAVFDHSIHGPVALALSFGFLTSAVDMSFILIAEQKVFFLNLFMALARIVSVIGVILCVAVPGDYVWFAVLTYGVNPLISLLSFGYFLKKYTFKMPDIAGMVQEFKATLPFGVFAFFTIASLKADVFLGEYLLPAAEFGVYAGVNKLYVSLVHLIGSLALVFFSESLASDEEATNRKVAKSATGLLLLCFGAVILGVSFGAEFAIGLLIGDRFLPGASALVVLVWTLFVMSGQSVISSQTYQKYGRMKEASVCQVVNILGTIGASLLFASVLTNLMMALALGVFTGRLFGLVYMFWVAEDSAEKAVISLSLQFFMPLGIAFACGYFAPVHWVGKAVIAEAAYVGMVVYLNRGFVRLVLDKVFRKLGFQSNKT